MAAEVSVSVSGALPPPVQSDGVDVVFADPIAKEDVPDDMKFAFEGDSSEVPYYLQGVCVCMYVFAERSYGLRNL